LIYGVGGSQQWDGVPSVSGQNSLKYAFPENCPGEIRVRLLEKESWLYLTVSDNGIGISDVDLPHIFDRFYRAHSDRSRQTGGTGLGLAIAIAIAKSHHGNIQVSSQLGKGSSFSIRLPLYDRANCDRTQ
jgi:signal transduction histidine kinase